MRVVLIHLGSALPKHARSCIRQITAVTGEPPVVIDRAAARKLRSDDRDRFLQVESLSGMGMKRFWRYACERFFVLEAAMHQLRLDRCIHIECDVLIYAAPEAYLGWLTDTYGAGLATCPLTDFEDTAAAMYVGSRGALAAFNAQLLDLAAVPPAELLAAHGGDMAHEMRLMHLLRTSFGLAASLPTTVASARQLGSHYIFDPASYGQCVDGIPGEPGVPRAEAHHHVGRELRSGNYRLRWDAQQRLPLVESASDACEYPLATLHVHSKRLERWAWDTRPPRRPRRLSGARSALRQRSGLVGGAVRSLRRDA